MWTRSLRVLVALAVCAGCIALADAPLSADEPSSYWVFFGNKDLHYEFGVYHTRKVVELGLHFESDALTNQLLLGALKGHAKTIAKKLPDARIEAWDKGWARVWEPIPLERFDEPYSARLVKTMARYVRVLEPILEDSLPADVRWSQ